ncbi:MAG: hypothetical protein INR71_01980, partial [Terriglobus roseus]|nr:hypothetical protein [Terriglobus roseus]
MPSNLADYLAKNYLTADTKDKKSKKRKRKEAAGFSIADDSSLGWEDGRASKGDDDG